MTHFSFILVGPCVAFSLIAACGGSTNPDENPHAKISGTVGGEVISVTDAIGYQEIHRGVGGAVSTVGFAASNRVGFCALGQRGEALSNLRFFTVEVGVAYSRGPDLEIAPGTYSLGNEAPPSLGTARPSVSMMSTDASCHQIADVRATSGSVTLATVTSSEIAGSFDVFFGSEHVTGTFDVPVCSNFATEWLAQAAAGSACK
jgi:hypothetical protein